MYIKVMQNPKKEIEKNNTIEILKDLVIWKFQKQKFSLYELCILKMSILIVYTKSCQTRNLVCPVKNSMNKVS